MIETSHARPRLLSEAQIRHIWAMPFEEIVSVEREGNEAAMIAEKETTALDASRFLERLAGED